jgi:putative membrane protein
VANVDRLVRLALGWAVNVAALWATAKLFDGVTSNGWGALIVAGLVFGIVNTFVRPLVVLLSLPFVVLTLGLFLFFINMAMLALTDWVVSGYDITGFWTFVGATIVVWVVNSALEAVLGLE